MKSLKLIEDGELSGVHITSDGYLAAQVKCARTGIQEYLGSELGLLSRDVIRVYRPEDEVFSEESMSSYAGKPATDDHPEEPVTAANWKKYTVGNIGSKVLRSGQYVDVPLILMDGPAIQKVQEGKRQLSMGYSMDLVMEPGTTPQGEPYDAIQRNLRMNHIALVDKGRAGNRVRIGDSWSSDRKPNDEKPTMTLKTIVVDGLTVETTDAAAMAIEKLQAQVKVATDSLTAANTAHETAIATASATHDTAMAAKDTELATKDAEIAKLSGQIVTGDALDKLVADRQVFMGKAQAIAKDTDFKGKTDLEIKAITVDSVRGEGFTKDQSETYINVAFDMLEVPEQTTDSVREVLKSKPVVTQTNDNGYGDYLKRLESGWNTQAGVQA